MSHQTSLGYFYESTDIPVCLCHSDGTVAYSHPASFSDAYLPEFLLTSIQSFVIQERNTHHPLILMTHPAFLLGILKVSEDDYLLLGPVSSIPYEQKDITDFCRAAVHPHHILDFKSAMVRTPLMTYRHFISAVAIANKLCTGRDIVVEEIMLHNSDFSYDEAESELTRQLFNLRETEFSHTAYEFEQTILAAVEAGDGTRLTSALLQPVTGRVGQMSVDMMRQEKYTFVAGATLISRAAVRGGLAYEAACALSDIYCLQMDSIRSIQDLSALTYQMFLDFCQHVHDLHGKSSLSKPVRDCCDYIFTHLHEDIRLDTLANVSGFCTKSISKKFLTETGHTVTDYIHREKLREAAQLLDSSSHTIAEIANYLQYSSQSYFSRLFKAGYGMTPRQYRESRQKI